MKRTIVILCLLLVCFVTGCSNQNSELTPPTETTDDVSDNIQTVIEPAENADGMRFNITMDKFIERYNKLVSDNKSENLWTLDNFQKLKDKTDSNGVGISSYYVYYDKKADKNIYIHLYMETQTGKICYVFWECTNYYWSELSDSEQERITNFDIPFLFMALNPELDYDSAVSLVKKISSLENYGLYYDSGISYIYTIDGNSENQVYKIWAMDKERYRTLYDDYKKWFNDNKSKFSDSKPDEEQWKFVKEKKSYIFKEDADLHTQNRPTTVKVGEAIPEGYYIVTSLAGECRVNARDDGNNLGKGMLDVFFLSDGTTLSFQESDLLKDNLAELKLTQTEKYELEEGTYIAGRDIPAGIYIVENETYSMSYTGVYIETNSKKSSAGAKTKITLNPGQTFRLFHEPESIEGNSTMFQLYEIGSLEN